MEDKSQSEEDNKQMQAIIEEKAALARQMVGLIFLSFLVSAAFYGLTIWENPKLLPSRWPTCVQLALRYARLRQSSFYFSSISLAC